MQNKILEQNYMEVFKKCNEMEAELFKREASPIQQACRHLTTTWADVTKEKL